MKLIIKCYSNDKIQFEEEFNHSSYYEVPYVQIGIKLNIIEPPLGYYENNIKGLRIRRNFKVTLDEKDQIFNNINLSKEDKELFILLKETIIEGYDNVKDFIHKLSGYKIGNIEDIISWFEDNNMDKINKIEFVEED